MINWNVTCQIAEFQTDLTNDLKHSEDFVDNLCTSDVQNKINYEINRTQPKEEHEIKRNEN